MPNTPSPIDGPLGPFWTAITQATAATKAKTAGLAAQAQQGGIYDRYLNTIELAASNLAQAVTIGASHGNAGVSVLTGQPNGTAGRVTQQNLATGSIDLGTGSTAATVTTTSGTFAAGMVIGAVTATGATALTPGTTITAVSGSTLTLSQAPAIAGSGLYCAAANFVLAIPGSWQTLALTLPSGVTVPAGYYEPALRLVSGDTVQMRGTVHNGGSTSYSPATLASGLPAPAATVQPGNWSVSTAGDLAVLNLPAGATASLDGVAYSLF